jgi:hypothetical protein
MPPHDSPAQDLALISGAHTQAWPGHCTRPLDKYILSIEFPRFASESEITRISSLHTIAPFSLLWPIMVLVHSFHLLWAVNLVRGVVAQDYLGSQPLSRLANGFIVEYAEDSQTRSVVSPSSLTSNKSISVECQGPYQEPLGCTCVLHLRIACGFAVVLSTRVLNGLHERMIQVARATWAVSANELVFSSPMAAANM